MSQIEESQLHDKKEDRDTEFERIREERQREVDRLSLELLSNSKHYKKYNTKQSAEHHRADNRQFLKYKSRVAALCIELLDEYEEPGESSTSVGPDLQYMFKECVQKMIQHLEWTEYNRNVDSAEFEDEDMMFATVSSHPNRRKSKLKTHLADPFSYWGATIRKSESTDQNDDLY